MGFTRDIQSQLEEWKRDPHRKPLVLRGPRQVGKTTAVLQFAGSFDNFLHFNLEREDDRMLMESRFSLRELIPFLFARKRVERKPGSTLLFIDEIQNSPASVSLLRYFYEECPEIHVIAAGSLLENVVDVHSTFPVGRVQFMAVHPCSFREFLTATGNGSLRQFLSSPQMSVALHEELMALFNQYAIVGGMPEVVGMYSTKRDVLALDNIYDSLLQSYKDDVEKYVRGQKLTDVVRFILMKGWENAGQVVTMNRFGGSEYRSRDVSEAFRLLEKAMVLELAYPTTAPDPPATMEIKRMPKLVWFDTGLVNYAAGVRLEMLGSMEIMDWWRGRIAEQMVAQELLSMNNRVGQRRTFWVKGNGSAEVDWIWTYKGKVYPIEVKAGHNSHLRSLHSFIDASHNDVAVRVWSNPLSVDNVKTIAGKPFRLINLPFYLVGSLETVLDELDFIKE